MEATNQKRIERRKRLIRFIELSNDFNRKTGLKAALDFHRFTPPLSNEEIELLESNNVFNSSTT